MNTLPLGEGLVLTVVGGGDGTRFVRTFRRAWKALPPAWRRRLKGHLSHGSSKITLRSRTIDSYIARRYRRRGGTLAWVTRDAKALNFVAAFFDWLPIRHGAVVVAHELAHVAQAITGGTTATSAAAEEEQVDWMVRAWNLDVDAADDWLDENIVRYWKGLPVWRTAGKKRAKKPPANRVRR